MMRPAKWTALAAVALLFSFSAWSPAAVANEITFVSAHIPPFSIKGEERAGFVGDIVSELARRMGVPIKLQYASSPQEAVKIVKSRPNTVIFPFARTEQREPHFLWVQKILEVPLVFVTAPGKPPIETITDAKALDSVGVRRGFAVRDLTDRGFNNLVIVDVPEDNGFALADGRIDAWYAPQPEILYTWRATNQEGLVVPGLKTRVIHSYLAASKPSPAIDLSRWQGAFAEMQREGAVDIIVESYLGR